MNQVGLAAYTGIFAGSLLLSLLLVPLALRFATRREVLDHPGGYKQQERAVPYLGGLAMLVAFAAVIAGAALLRPPTSGLDELLVILGSAVVLGVVGLVDDLRGLGVVVRVSITVAVAVTLYLSGTQIQLTGIPVVDGTLTVVWIVGIVNAMNLLDNMDGLSAGVATIAALTFFVIAALNGQFLIAALSIALVGCAAGFLRHNRYPAKIYMGDAGSLFLGLMLAVIAIRLRFGAPRQITAFVPLIVLTVPILDTALVTITRLREGRSVLQGGADHTSHRLVQLGMRVPSAVLLIYVVAGFSSWLAIVISRQTDLLAAYLLVTLWVAVAGLAGGFLARSTTDQPLERSVEHVEQVSEHTPSARPTAAVSTRRDEVPTESGPR